MDSIYRVERVLDKIEAASSKKSRACYEAAEVTQDKYFVLVALNNAAWPHTDTGGLSVDHYSFSINFASGTAQANIRLGVVTEIDGTEATIAYLINHTVGVQGANDGVVIDENFQPSSVKFRVEDNLLVGAITSIKENTEAVNSEVSLDSPAGNVTPALGDIIIKAEWVADNYNMVANVIYHSDA